MPEERQFQLALTLVPGLGDVLVKTLISYLGDAKTVFNSTIPQLVKVPGIGPNLARSIKNFDISLANNEYALLSDKAIETVFYTDKKYPQRLKTIYDAPAMLYYTGNVDLNHARIVAIVGTRNATSHGKAFVRDFVKGLAHTNVIIVSGLAYGIDIEAHKTALEYNIPTIGVIASGLDIVYPGIHKKYARKMVENGGLITEYPLRTKLDPARFPARNRIIAGMSDAVVVVEAAIKGGALITAELAAGYDREIFSIPGRYNDPFSEGCNALIRNNAAQAITSVDDFQFYMQWPDQDNIIDEKVLLLDQEEFSDEEWAVISIIKKEGKELHIDELGWKSKIQAGKLATVLLNLEFRGIVNSNPGKKYFLN